jgi:ribosomal protein L37AE/L43A
MVDFRYLARYNGNMPRKSAQLIEEQEKFPCPACKSTDKCRNGFKYNGDEQRYKCKNCGRNFIIGTSAPRINYKANREKIRLLTYYLAPNPTELYTEYQRRWERRKYIIDHGDYVEVLRRDIRSMARDAEVSPTTFYKAINNLKARLAALDTDTLPDSLNAALGGKKPNIDLIRAKISPQEKWALLEFLYLN